MSTYPMTMTWADHGTPIRLDIFCLVFAMLFHLPLYFKTYDFKGRYHDTKKKDRLVSVNLIDAEALIKPPVVVPPPVQPAKKSMADRLKALFKNEPPPPPPTIAPPPPPPPNLR